jgi:hypothetical protein
LHGCPQRRHLAIDDPVVVKLLREELHDASALEVGVVAMAQYLGIPLLGPVAGVLVDRWDKRLTQGSEGSHKAQISQASRREAEDDLNFRPSFGGARRAT